MKQTILEKIRQRRRQMLVHSYIYYELNQNIISDYTWSKWAKELAELQEKYPRESAEVEFADLFNGWDGSSGAFLIFPEFSITVANHLLRIKDKKEASIKKVVDKPKKAKSSATRKLF